MKNTKYEIRNTKQRGQSLFEVVVAMGLGALIIIAIVSLAASSIASGTFAKNNTLASRYAQEGIEWLRAQRDVDMTGFNSAVNSYGISRRCLPSPLPANLTGVSGSVCTTSQLIDGRFDREIEFCPTGSVTCFGSPNVPTVGIYAKVSVSWTDAKGLHTVDTITNFTDWRTQ